MRLHMGSTMMVVGPTNSGKTVFIMNLIDNARELFDITPTHVYWCYGHRTAEHENMTRRGYNMIFGIPQNFDIIPPNSIIVLDDLMMESANDRHVSNLFIRTAHHKPCFVIYTQQNLFPRGDNESRNRAINTQYLVLFKNPMDQLSIRYLEQRMYPHSKGFLVKAFTRATSSQAHTYLFIDSHQKTPEIVRLRSRILPYERPMVVFVDKRNFADVTVGRLLQNE